MIFIFFRSFLFGLRWVTKYFLEANLQWTFLYINFREIYFSLRSLQNKYDYNCCLWNVSEFMISTYFFCVWVLLHLVQVSIVILKSPRFRQEFKNRIDLILIFSKKKNYCFSEGLKFNYFLIIFRINATRDMCSLLKEHSARTEERLSKCNEIVLKDWSPTILILL